MHISKLIYHRHPWILDRLLGGVLDYRCCCQWRALVSVAHNLSCRLTCSCCLSLCHLVRSSALPRGSKNNVNTYSDNNSILLSVGKSFNYTDMYSFIKLKCIVSPNYRLYTVPLSIKVAMFCYWKKVLQYKNVICDKCLYLTQLVLNLLSPSM